MPFATEAKARPSGTGRGCRAVVAAGMLDPGSEWTVFRALQIANFTSPTLFLDDTESIREALREVPGVDADGIAERIDDADVVAEYERQQAEARSAAGTPSEAQDKTATRTGTCGSRRRPSCSVVERTSAFAGGWQPLLSYDTVLANFAPELERVPPPESPEPLLEHFPAGLTTAEIALLLADGSDPIPDQRRSRAHAARARGVRTGGTRGRRWRRGLEQRARSRRLTTAFLPKRLLRLARRCSSRTGRHSSSSSRSRRRGDAPRSAVAGSPRRGSRSCEVEWEVGVAVEALGEHGASARGDRPGDGKYRAGIARDRRARSLEREIAVIRKRLDAKRAEPDAKRAAPGPARAARGEARCRTPRRSSSASTRQAPSRVLRATVRASREIADRPPDPRGEAGRPALVVVPRPFLVGRQRPGIRGCPDDRPRSGSRPEATGRGAREGACGDPGRAVAAAPLPPAAQVVRFAVWCRDKGRCVDCGTSERVAFDRILPFDEGGSTRLRTSSCAVSPARSGARERGARPGDASAGRRGYLLPLADQFARQPCFHLACRNPKLSTFAVRQSHCADLALLDRSVDRARTHTECPCCLARRQQFPVSDSDRVMSRLPNERKRAPAIRLPIRRGACRPAEGGCARRQGRPS